MPQISKDIIPCTIVGTSTGMSGGSYIMRPRMVMIGSSYKFPQCGTTGTIVNNFRTMTDSDILDMSKGSVVANASQFTPVGFINSVGASTASGSSSSLPYNFGIPAVAYRTYHGNSGSFLSTITNATKYCSTSVIRNASLTIGSFTGYVAGGYQIASDRPLSTVEIHVIINLANSYSPDGLDVYVGRLNSSGTPSYVQIPAVGLNSVCRHYYLRANWASAYISQPMIIRPNNKNYRARVYWAYALISSVT